MRKHKSDRIITILTVLLLIIGLVVIYAVGPMRANFMNAAYGSELSSNYFFSHQLINVGISLVAFVIAFKFPYEKLRKFAKIVMIFGILMCAFLEVMALAGSGLAKCELGACRWINLGGLGSIQPAEILKLGLVLYLSQLAAVRKKEGKLETSDFFIPAGVYSGLALIFTVVLQKDLGTGVAIIAIVLGILFMSGVKMRVFMGILGVILVGGVLAVLTSPHRMERVMTFVKGDEADSYHIENAMIAIGTGGLTGVGVGNSVQATGYLPESINDSVFAIMGETFGYVGLLVVVLAFATLLARIMGVMERGEDEEHRLVATGVFSWVLAQMAINIMAMTGLIPLTGITLPLLSYGGTSMMFIAISLGIVAQLSCYTKRVTKNNQKKSFSSRGIRREA
ncbi:FtsW/RodA/SpoVE family cell cycle protein [Candidatus Saccharibacteria bacterium]|nr:FtsW/RodA/SpoVE family cell cycle protein [Candidatus Saccharibacteria bacterium]